MNKLSSKSDVNIKIDFSLEQASFRNQFNKRDCTTKQINQYEIIDPNILIEHCRKIIVVVIMITNQL